MAEKLSVLIELAGAEEIQRQLEGIGEAGSKAFAQIGKAAEKVGGFEKLDPKDTIAKLQKLGVTGKAEIDKITAAVAAASRLDRIVAGVAQVEQGFAQIGVAATAMSQQIVTGVTAAGAAMTRSLGPLGGLLRALGPVGIAAGVLGGAFLKSSFEAAQAISEINRQAAKLGLTIEQFDTLRLGFEKAGISSKAIADGMQHLQTVFDKLNLEGIKKALEELLPLGRFAEGTVRLNVLREAAKGIGPVADAARQALEKLGLAKDINPFKPLADSLGPLQNLLKELGLTTKEFGQGLATLNAEKIATIIEKLQQLPDGVDRTKLAIALFGETLGVELIGAMRTGSIAVDEFRGKLGGLTREQQIAAAQQEQSLNRLSAAWKRFSAEGISPILVPVFDFLTRQIKQFQKDFNAISRDIEIAWAGLQAIFRDPIGILKAALDGFLADVEKLFSVITTGPANAWQWLVTKFNAAVAGIGAKINEIQSLLIAWVTAPIGNAWTWLVTTFNTVIAQIPALAQRAVAVITALVTTSVSNAWQWVVTTFNAVIAQIPVLVQTAVAAVTAFVTTSVGNAWQWVIDTLNSVIGQIPGLAQTALAAVASLVTTPIANAWQWIVDTLKAVIAQIPGLGAALGMSGGGQVGGFQSGGQVGGRGTGTSDSNLVRVSRGEYIIPARAVRQPGVLAFLEALRRSGGSLRDVLDDMGRFALGGLVPRAIPAFATGGMAGGGMSNVTIQFPGMPEISGLRAPAKVVEELRKTAALAQVRSGGRKPSRYS